MGRCAVYNPHIMFACLAEWWELRQRVCAGICLRELVAFGMDPNGKDE